MLTKLVKPAGKQQHHEDGAEQAGSEQQEHAPAKGGIGAMHLAFDAWVRRAMGGV